MNPLYIALLNFAVAVMQMHAHAAEQGRLPTDAEIADLERSTAAVALKRARWQATLPKKDPQT